MMTFSIFEEFWTQVLFGGFAILFSLFLTIGIMKVLDNIADSDIWVKKKDRDE